jgi:hypothetical protein
VSPDPPYEVTAIELYVIGNPGRAASEVQVGPPPARVGPADSELSVAAVAGMEILAVSSRGLEHRAAGVVRQDAFALGLLTAPDGPDRLVAVVCDGVGSMARSDEAALLASRRLAVLGAAGVAWPEAFARVNSELRTVAGDAGRDVGPTDGGMATTAAALAVHREGDDWVGEVAWVGDSALWHLDGALRWVPLTSPPDDDMEPGFYSGEVVTLPGSDGIPATLSTRLCAGALFLMSDGIANPLRWSADVRGTLARWWGLPPAPYTFAAQVGFARQTHVDDRTVIGIWPDRGKAHAAEV